MSVVGTQVVRSVRAPTEDEARSMMEPVRQAFLRDGWQIVDELWIPGDRRVGLGESLVLDADHENLLEADGTFRIVFLPREAGQVPPAADVALREPDVFEQIGGVRYRRVVPRIAIQLALGAVLLVIALVVMSQMSRSGPGGRGSLLDFPDTQVIEGRTYRCDDNGSCTYP
jgi:hypothetical protein